MTKGQSKADEKFIDYDVGPNPKTKEAHRNGHFAEDFMDGKRARLQPRGQVAWAVYPTQPGT